MEDVKNNIRQIRERFGLSQAKMAEKMHMTQSAYSRIELGKTLISTDFMCDFANELDMNMIDVITWPKKYVDRDTFTQKNDISILLQKIENMERELAAKDKLIALYEKLHTK